MRKLGEQWVEEIDRKKHMLKAVHNEKKNCNGCVHGRDYNKDSCLAEPKYPCGYMDLIIKDLGILNKDGCLPAPWDETKYPKITVLIGNVYNIEVMKGHWFMQVRGDTLEKAVERWNRRV